MEHQQICKHLYKKSLNVKGPSNWAEKNVKGFDNIVLLKIWNKIVLD